MSDLSTNPVALKILQVLERAGRPMRHSELESRVRSNQLRAVLDFLILTSRVRSEDVDVRFRVGQPNRGATERRYTLVKPDTMPRVVGVAEAWDRLDRALTVRARADKVVELALDDLRIATGASDG